jgi:3-oxoacyl-[acyl-carrier-protein] synthase II
MGVVTPAGCTPEALWAGLQAGRSAAAPLPDVDLGRGRVAFGCRVAGFEATDKVAGKEARRMDPFARYGVTAALAAWDDAGAPDPGPTRGAVVVGTTVGGRATSDAETRNYVEAGPQRVNPLFPVVSMPNAAAAHIAIRLGWRGPALSIATACASGADAVGQGVALLQSGRADVVMAGGCEAALTAVTLAAFANLAATSARGDDPERACRPFDADRDGFVMGEGAAFVVLERAGDARARGATARAMVAGYAATADAHHLAMPADDGVGAAECMRAALADAGIGPAEVAHVNAHGTSTPHNDRAEATALHHVFGADVPPVTATKGVVGHLIGAAGAVELVATVLALDHRTVPPTANHERTEPGMEIDVVHGHPRPLAPGPALSNSFGFGGHNACLVVAPA